MLKLLTIGTSASQCGKKAAEVEAVAEAQAVASRRIHTSGFLRVVHCCKAHEYAGP